MMRIGPAIALLLGCAGCEGKPKMTMSAQQVIESVKDYADRGCQCDTDKECFQQIRDEWDAAKREIVKNANLMTGADRDAYQAERTRFGLCGDRAGLAVFDGV